MEQNEEQFIKAFNAGYQMSKHDPALLAQILQKADPEQEYIKAMLLGKKEHDREKVLQKLRQPKDRSRDLER